MTNPRIVYKNFIRDADILAYSSENPQYPSENLQDDIIDSSLSYRSRYGTGTGNGRFVVTAGANDKIDFDEGGAELTATLTAATYTGQTLATEVKTQLDAAGALTYTVTYSETTGKFTIAATGNFTLRWSTGTNKAVDASGLLGYSDAADDTGAATYDSDTVVCHTSEALDFDLGAVYEYDSIGLVNHNLTASAVITIYGADDSAFTSNVVSDVIAHSGNNIYAYLNAARTKRYVRVTIVDVANPDCYVQIGAFIVGKYYTLDRQTGPHAYGPMDESEVEKSPSSHLFTVQERPKLDTWEYQFTTLNAASAAIVLALLEECGLTKSFWICTDSAAPSTNSTWGRLKEISLPYRVTAGTWNWECPMEETL